VLWNNPDALGAGDVDTTAVVLANPGYCQPFALNYGYGSASPVMGLQAIISPGTLEQVCPGVVGVIGPPCGQTLTNAGVAPPRVSRLLPAVPNPFNPTTRLGIELATAGNVDLVIYDVRGRRVIDLLPRTPLGPGRHDVLWHGEDQQRRPVASGIYYVRLRVDSEPVGDAKKLVLVR
jgi:hypothetical protein